MYAAKVIADSIAAGVRLTTLEVTMPRIVLAEFNTHRVFSRNSASSRAIPVEKRMRAIRDNPFVPEAFALNKPGMQAGEELDERDNSKARDAWLQGRDSALWAADKLLDSGVHKQWVNRLLEPFSWTTVVVTATEWENFFNLRISALAQPEIRKAAELMEAAMDASSPISASPGYWHLPYVQPHEFEEFYRDETHHGAMKLVKLSTARCARVSYLTHDGVPNQAKDLELYDKLLSSRHMSPFEHPAVATHHDPTFRWRSNFRAPWHQHRKQIIDEAVALKEAQCL